MGVSRIIVLDQLAQEGLDLLDAHPQIEYEVRLKLAGAELKQALTEFDGAICRSGVKLMADVLEGNRRLKAIVRAGVGTDNIDSRAAKRQGIVVMNTPAGNTISTAEHAIALMMALSRNIAPACQSLREGRWDRGKFMGTQLAGKTLGIVGLGRIGQALASRARGLEMRLLGYDPFISAERASQLGVELCPAVADMIPKVDYLTVHTPLTDETRGLVGLKEIEAMKPGARLINCARGGIYDEAALAQGLESGKLAGVALDVFTNESELSKGKCEHPLFGMPGVLVTPHLGASTEEAQTSVAVEAAELLVAFLTTGAVRHAVNMPPIDPSELAPLRPSLNLAYRLGLLHSQLALSARPKSCVLRLRGKVAESANTKLVSASFAAGFLQQVLDYEVNIVNAEELLRERGLDFSLENDAKPGDFSSLITAQTGTDDGHQFTTAATVFGNEMMRLVRIDEFRLETYLDGILLLFKHRDVPGIIGAVGTAFGKHNVNIAQMAVGREMPGGEAIGVLNLDQEPGEEALAEVAALPHIESCVCIKLPPAGEYPPWLSV